jgi:hypothetical protein
MTVVSSASRLVRGLSSPFLDLLPADGIAISVLDRDRKASTIYASDDTAARLEELHFDLGEGPLLQAFADVRPVVIADVGADGQWPAFSEAAAALDVGSLFVFPLTLGAACIGAVLCYRTARGEPDPVSMETGAALSRAIAGPTFRHAILLADSEDPDSFSPIEMRRDVHRATGMVLYQLDTSATDAFARMRGYAFANGMSLREVAVQVLARRLDFSTVSD